MEYAVQAIGTVNDKKERRRIARQATKSFSRIFLALVLYTAVASAVIIGTEFILIALLGIEGAASAFENPYVVWGLQVLSMYIIALPVFFALVKRLPKRQIKKSSMGFGEFLGTFFMCETVMLIGNLISTYLVDYLSTVMGYEIANTTSDLIYESPLWLVIAVAVVIGPIVEELIFRKAIIDRLGMYGERFAVAVSAVAFGLFHGNLSQLIYATAVGFIFGYVYTRTGKIKNSCILHIAVNFMGTVPALLISDDVARLDEMLASGGDPDMYTYIMELMPILLVALMQYALAIIGIVVFVRRIDKGSMRLSGKCDIRLSGWRKFRCSVFNFGAILFYVLCVAQIALSLTQMI